ncbi:DNA polymerase III subunit epsilon [Microbacterium sp. LMI12-1-1.1]|uniref:exonuclease domain-containing protein n=1 Tax=Microbacterium sp. LMI12-1-1.1 TaxID=3135225 RepID=UPI00342C0CC4
MSVILVPFDTETTGTDVENDRIVQAFLGLMGPDGHWQKAQTWLINPGVPVPEGAARVHGLSTEHLQQHGNPDVRSVLEQIRSIIVAEVYDRPDVALVIYNAQFDTTILNAELRRHGLEEIDYSRVNVIDPLVLDKRIYKFRRGSGARKLTAVAPIYGVPVEENAHDASADCLMAGRVALQQLRHEYLQGQTITRLQHYQRVWKAEQSADLEKWFRTKAPADRRDPNLVIPRDWPIIPAAAAA